MSSCHVTTQHFGNADLTIALAGNPNVGKSSLFNRMTGANVETANYPGKTVALNFGVTHFDGKRIGVVDLPGTYALGALSEDQWVARQAVLDDPPADRKTIRKQELPELVKEPADHRIN